MPPVETQLTVVIVAASLGEHPADVVTTISRRAQARARAARDCRRASPNLTPIRVPRRRRDLSISSGDIHGLAWAGLQPDRYSWTAVLHRGRGGGVQRFENLIDDDHGWPTVAI